MLLLCLTAFIRKQISAPFSSRNRFANRLFYSVPPTDGMWPNKEMDQQDQFSYRALRYFTNDPTPPYIKGIINTFTSSIIEAYYNEPKPLSLETYQSYAFKFATKSMQAELETLMGDLLQDGHQPTPYIMNMRIFCLILRTPKSEIANLFGSEERLNTSPSPSTLILQKYLEEVKRAQIPLEMCIFERLAYLFFKAKNSFAISNLIVNMKIKLIQPSPLIYYYWLFLLSNDKNPLPYLNTLKAVQDSGLITEDIRKLNLVWSCLNSDYLTITSNLDDTIRCHKKPSFFITLVISELLRCRRAEDASKLFKYYTRDKNSANVVFSSKDFTVLLDACIHTASFDVSNYFLEKLTSPDTGSPHDSMHDHLVLKIYSQSNQTKLLPLMKSLKVHRKWSIHSIDVVNMVLDACYKNVIVNHYMFDILEDDIDTLYHIYEAQFPGTKNSVFYSTFYESTSDRLFDSIKTIQNRMRFICDNFSRDSILFELACLNLDPFIFRVLLILSKYHLKPNHETLAIIFYYYVNVRANLKELARFYLLVKPLLHEMYYGAVNSLFSSTIRNKCWHVAASLLAFIFQKRMPLKSYNLKIAQRFHDIKYTAKKYQITCSTQRISSLIGRIKKILTIKAEDLRASKYSEMHEREILRLFTSERLTELDAQFSANNIIYVAQLQDLDRDQWKILFKLSAAEVNLLGKLLMVPDLEKAPAQDNDDDDQNYCSNL